MDNLKIPQSYKYIPMDAERLSTYTGSLLPSEHLPYLSPEIKNDIPKSIMRSILKGGAALRQNENLNEVAIHYYEDQQKKRKRQSTITVGAMVASAPPPEPPPPTHETKLIQTTPPKEEHPQKESTTAAKEPPTPPPPPEKKGKESKDQEKGLSPRKVYPDIAITAEKEYTGTPKAKKTLTPTTPLPPKFRYISVTPPRKRESPGKAKPIQKPTIQKPPSKGSDTKKVTDEQSVRRSSREKKETQRYISKQK